MSINDARLSLNEKFFSWLLICAVFRLSRISYAFGSKTSVLLHCLSVFSWVTSARYWICLRSSLMEVNDNMSIQTSLKRFKSKENLSIHLIISLLPHLTRLNWFKKKPNEVSIYSWNTWLHRRLSETLGQEVLYVFLHLRKVCSLVLIVDFLLQVLYDLSNRRSALILKAGRRSIKERWNLCRDVIPTFHWSFDSARYAPIKDSNRLTLFSTEKSSRSFS